MTGSLEAMLVHHDWLAIGDAGSPGFYDMRSIALPNIVVTFQD